MITLIEQQMRSLKLIGMAQAWKELELNRQLSDLSINDGLTLLLQAELREKTSKRFDRLIKNANFRYQASMDEIICSAARNLDKSLIEELSTINYIAKGVPILICGASGSGKSFLASALGHQACYLGKKVAYYNTQKLIAKLRISRVDGTYFNFMEKTAKTDVLILDDFGLMPLQGQELIDMMEIIEDRHGLKSTIIASQIPFAKWYEVMGEATIADAILDRLIHTAYKIELKGENLRKKR
ncbi:MAG: ATP-binding protein [Flavobacteriia bacterium 40-80]|nr:IS21-like element helper ATPase IstB [uncultured Dyadobacter sp.]OJX37576.1 MAG: ATP-binding protein [Flavobacteriia bacterium 40-80]